MFELEASQWRKSSFNCGSTGNGVFHISRLKSSMGSTEFLNSQLVGAQTA